MVREIYSITIEESGGFLDIRIRGNGFLYNMVRKIVGTLIKVGHGEIDANSITDILRSKERVQTGGLAEPGGLYLESIDFE